MKWKHLFWVATMAMTSVWAKDYSGAELFSSETFMYGKFEARMRMAAASGLVSSMFLYYNDSYKGDPEPWVEIDIEVLGKSPASFQSNIISGSANAKKTSEKHHSISPAANETYHTYAMEWTPNYISWSIDGNEVRRTVRDSNDTKKQVEAMVKPQDLRFNLWSSEVTSWVGAFDDAVLPMYQYINWVKVYEYTPGAGENGSDFTLKWTDDFDTFDTDRWNTGNWTFDENRVDMHPDNVIVKDGTLILAITRAGEEGFDNSPIPQDDAYSAISSGISKTPWRPQLFQETLFLPKALSGCCSSKIYASSGEVLMQGVHEKSGEISIRNLPAGHYILKVQGNSQSHSYPFRKL